MPLITLIAALLIVGVVMCLFEVDAGMKKLIYVVCAVAVIIVLLSAIGVGFGDLRIGR